MARHSVALLAAALAACLLAAPALADNDQHDPPHPLDKFQGASFATVINPAYSINLNTTTFTGSGQSVLATIVGALPASCMRALAPHNITCTFYSYLEARHSHEWLPACKFFCMQGRRRRTILAPVVCCLNWQAPARPRTSSRSTSQATLTPRSSCSSSTSPARRSPATWAPEPGHMCEWPFCAAHELLLGCKQHSGCIYCAPTAQLRVPVPHAGGRSTMGTSIL